MKKIKHFFYNLLFSHSGVESKIFNGFIAILVIVSIAILPFYFFSYFEHLYKKLWIIETFIIIIFTLEFFLKIYASQKINNYLFSFSAFIDAIVIIPFFLIEFRIIENNYFLISLQILRIIKLIHMYNLERKNIKHEEITEHGSFKLLKGEIIYKIAHKHYFIFLFSLIPVITISFASLAILLLYPSTQTLILSIIFAFFAFIKFIKNWINFHYDALYITSNRLVVQDQHLFGANRTEIPYRAIAQILPNQKGFIRSFFNFGDIKIETAGETTNTDIKYIPDMEKVLKIVTREIEKNRNPMLMYQQKEKNNREKKREKKGKMKKGIMNKKNYKNILNPNKNHPLFKEDDIKKRQKENYKKIFNLFSTTKK